MPRTTTVAGRVLASLDRLDLGAYRALNAARGPVADAAFGAVTELGSIWASAGAGLALAARGRRRAAIDATGAAALTWLVGQALKRVVDRPRPYSAHGDVRLLIDRPRGTSWPSSHPAVLMAFVTVATRRLDLAPTGTAAALALTAAVGVSRVYLGVHYPGDVAGGLLIGRGIGGAWSRVSARLVPPRLP